MYINKLHRKMYFLSIILILLGAVSSFGQKTRGAGNAPKKDLVVSSTQSTTTDKNSQSPTGKKTIVVLDFDDASLSEKKIQVGRQAALFLANRFSDTKNYTVIERQRLLQLLDEQNISQNADRYDAKLASKIGKLFSASAVVLGTVTEYTVKTSTKGLPGFRRVTIAAKIGLVIRLVDVNTGVLLDSVTVDGNAEEKSTSTLWGEQSTAENEDLRIRLFTAAANNAVEKAITNLLPTIDKVPESKALPTPGTKGPVVPSTTTPADKTSSSGKIAQVSGNLIYISGLKEVNIGDRFIVNRVGREIKDPDTGEVLDVESVKIGEVEITEVKPKLVVAKVISGSGFKVKDVVNPNE